MIWRVTALSRLIDRRVRELGLSNRGVVERSQGCPVGRISTGTIGQYRSGTHPVNPGDRILRVLSWTLDLPLPDLQRAAGTKESLGAWKPPPEADRMTARQRKLVEEIIVEFTSQDTDPGSTYLGTLGAGEMPTRKEPGEDLRPPDPDRNDQDDPEDASSSPG